MKNQIKLYSVDTKAFYNDEEREINARITQISKEIAELHEYATYAVKKEAKGEEPLLLEDWKEQKDIKNVFSRIKRNEEQQELLEAARAHLNLGRVKYSVKDATARQKSFEEYHDLMHEKNELREALKELLADFTGRRELNSDETTTSLKPYNVVSIFDSNTTRTLAIEREKVTMDMIIVTVYHYDVMEQLIKHGFTYEGTGYRIFTASAGQIRNKKLVFMKESAWEQHEKTLMCGLTIDRINELGGMNINKFLAYLALNNSATDKWEDFDIDQTIVIEDFESLVTGEVDFVDNSTFEVTRKEMQVPIPHSDGCGMMLPEVSKKNRMVRAPWIKGLLTPSDFIAFCDEYRDGDYTITDIYGKKYDLKKDNIKILFSKSQFKLWSFYSSWDEYKTYFKQYGCSASTCNEEPNAKQFRKANFNYQMWQTLTDMTDAEIAEFTAPVAEKILKGYTDRDTMLELLGATKDNQYRSNLQECIRLYPELIGGDQFVKEELSAKLNKAKKEAKYGKFRINATYTFIIPDVLAWMQNVFLGSESPEGILQDGEVSCRLYSKQEELLVNRSPQLYREHGHRKNVVNSDTKKWFLTNGVYTSSHDLISKLLQFDVDGDKALVVAEPTLIEVAKRNMKGIVPLYYEMGKAKGGEVNGDSINESLRAAFKYGNIGGFSNSLTMLWNFDNIDANTLTLIKQITALNNFSIDSAKTLEMPNPPKIVTDMMNKTNKNLPYFFQFAKDKDASSVRAINNSTMNRICRDIEAVKRSRYDYKALGRFDYRKLMSDDLTAMREDVILKYLELSEEKDMLFLKAKKDELVAGSIYDYITDKFTAFTEDLEVTLNEAVDIIIRYLYTDGKNLNKTMLYECFGDMIIENLHKNLKKHLEDGYIQCECCGKRIKKTNNRIKYCPSCARKENIKKTNRVKTA